MVKANIGLDWIRLKCVFLCAAGPSDADVECDVAEGSAHVVGGLPEGIHSDQRRSAAGPRQPQHPSDRRRLQRGREAVQVCAPPAVAHAHTRSFFLKFTLLQELISIKSLIFTI